MPTLVTIPYSHFCEKARWSLDRAGVDYREEGHAPLLHRLAVRRARGKWGSVPVLVLGDRVVDDSPRIVRWADVQAPADRKLLPAAGPALDEALALERHLDVDYAPHVRRLLYFHMLPDRAGTLALMSLRVPRRQAFAVRAGFPLLRALIRRAMRIDASGAARSRDKVRAVLGEIDARLSDGRPYLLGDRFTGVDIAFASFSAPLFGPNEHPVYGSPPSSLLPTALFHEVDGLRGSPGARFVARMYCEHRRRAG